MRGMIGEPPYPAQVAGTDIGWVVNRAVDVALELVQEERTKAAKKIVELAESRGHHGSATVALFVEWCRRGDV